jgi:hypothetical protein
MGHRANFDGWIGNTLDIHVFVWMMLLMLSRLPLIAALVLQPLLAWGAGPCARGVDDSAKPVVHSCCCAMAQVKACDVTGQKMAGCGCNGSKPTEQPITPAPRDGTQQALSAIVNLAGICVEWIANPGSRTSFQHDEPAKLGLGPSVQALNCVWIT